MFKRFPFMDLKDFSVEIKNFKLKESFSAKTQVLELI